MPRGRFIVLEGIDGSGTTSQVQALRRALEDRGHGVLATHQPSDGSIGRSIRGFLRREGPGIDPAALALLFAADRLDHVQREIEPALRRGDVVLCDRYVVSSWAYQSLQCDAAWVRTINDRAPWPDLTLVLQLPVDEALRRVHARDQAKEIYETTTIQHRVAQAYAEVVAEALRGVVTIDGTQDKDAVTRACLAEIDRLGL